MILSDEEIDWLLENLPEDYYKTFYHEALKPDELRKLKKILFCLEFRSFDSFGRMFLRDCKLIRDNPAKFWTGEFATHIENVRNRIHGTTNLLGAIRYRIGLRLFIKHIDEINFQGFVFIRNSPSNNSSIAAQMLITSLRKFSAFTGDTELLERISDYESKLSDTEADEILVKRDWILMNWDVHIFRINLSEQQLLRLFDLLSTSKFNFLSKQSLPTYKLITGLPLKDSEQIEKGLQWNRSASELVFLFYLLKEFKFIAYSDSEKPLNLIASNFIDSKGIFFKVRTLQKAMERGEFYRPFDPNIFPSNLKGGRSVIFEIVSSLNDVVH